MPNTLTWSYVWPRLTVLVAALALVVLAGSGMLYWKLQQAGAEARLAAVIAETLETADTVVAAAATHARSLRTASETPSDDNGRDALSGAAGQLRTLSRVLSLAAYRAGAPAVAQDGPDGQLDPRLQAAARAAMPAGVLKVWLGAGDGQPVADEMAAMAEDASALAADSQATAAKARDIGQKMARSNNSRIRPQLTAMRNAMNAALVSDSDANRNLVGLVAGILIAAGAVLFAILPVAMMRRAPLAPLAASAALAGSGASPMQHRRSDRVRLGFLSRLDTEIRTSVSGVTAMADLIARTELDGHQRGCVDVIARSGRALLDVTGNALDYARADSETLQLEPAPFPLRETVEDVADAMAPAAAAKGLDLTVRIAPDLPNGFIGDAPRIRQVLAALVGHAIETGDGGDVAIDVSGVHGANATASLAVRVRATGARMEKTALKHLFDPFTEETAGESPLSPATQLRLVLASRLARLMNGKVSADAAAEGGIALTATLSIPIDQARRDAKELTASLGTGRRLLVIDDSEACRESLTTMARDFGFEAAAAEDGRLGGLFANHMAGLGKPLDLILIDDGLGSQTGMQVAAELRADEQIRETALVLMTTPGAALAEDELRRNGIAAAMVKPIGPVRLAQTVRAALEKPRAAVSGTTAETGQAPQSGPQQDNMPLDELAGVVGVAADSDAPVEEGDEPRLQVLVAEDNEVNQLVFSQILEGLDLRFRIAVNGRDAVEDFKTHKPQMILMDVSMPEMNGLEATRAIRELEMETGIRTPIVGVTAHSLRGDQEKCMEAGMDDYMSKPISPDMIGAKIAKWMERRRPQNDRRRA